MKLSTGHKVLLGTTGLIGAWYLSGHMIHHFDKRNAINQIQREVPEGSKILNVGCKKFWVEDERYEIVNIDVVPRDVPNFQLADVRSLPFPDRSFDAIYISHVLEHLVPEDVEVAMSELYRVCKDPERVYIVLPRPNLLTTWADWDHQWVPVGSAMVRNPISRLKPNPVQTYAVIKEGRIFGFVVG